VFAIFNRYFDRSLLPQKEINGRPNYNLGPIKFAAAISVFWGIAGFTVGLLIACQLAWPVLNFDLPWTSFGRLRPLHTSAVIFAFAQRIDRHIVPRCPKWHPVSLRVTTIGT
jgi:cytochrome c oxidase cbb3-type subunit I